MDRAILPETRVSIVSVMVDSGGLMSTLFRITCVSFILGFVLLAPILLKFKVLVWYRSSLTRTAITLVTLRFDLSLFMARERCIPAKVHFAFVQWSYKLVHNMTVITDHKQILTGRRFSKMYLYVELLAHCCTVSYFCTCYMGISKTEEA